SSGSSPRRPRLNSERAKRSWSTRGWAIAPSLAAREPRIRAYHRRPMHGDGPLTTDALPPHVRRMVDEIETEIGEEPGRASSTIEGEGRDPDANGRVEDAVRHILLEIGEDPERQGLAGTPERVHRMYTELTAGYQ